MPTGDKMPVATKDDIIGLQRDFNESIGKVHTRINVQGECLADIKIAIAKIAQYQHDNSRPCPDHRQLRREVDEMKESKYDTSRTVKSNVIRSLVHVCELAAVGLFMYFVFGN